MGLVFDIQKFCTRDGPGIRTTVFLKGCPLHCAWCHNPESLSVKPELLYNHEKCVHCGRCAQLCPMGCHRMEDGRHVMDHTNCIGCFACIGCGALRPAGKEMTAQEVVERVLEDEPFYGDDGGMTVSGGEPFYQFDFLMELLKLAKEKGVHTAVETSGFTTKERILQAAPYIDLFLYDFKVADPAAHKELVGVDNAVILENLRAIGQAGSRIILRCPIIPGANFTRQQAEAIAKTAAENPGIVEIDLEPYHALGLSKSLQLGKESQDRFQVPPGPEMDQFVAWVEAECDVPVVVN